MGEPCTTAHCGDSPPRALLLLRLLLAMLLLLLLPLQLLLWLLQLLLAVLVLVLDSGMAPARAAAAAARLAAAAVEEGSWDSRRLPRSFTRSASLVLTRAAVRRGGRGRTILRVPAVVRGVAGAAAGHERMEAELEIGFQMLREKYLSHVTYKRPLFVVARSTDTNLFQHLTNHWEFSPGRVPGSCLLSFSVDFQFRSLLYTQFLDLFFDEVVSSLVNSFEQRCEEIYGPSRVVMTN
ncbi:hypothetical protein CLOM_g4280 [Closterium sp. NIES-68]|nr:hypothetical protein CLOM_g4280 [Closterium sp. NIES-68]